VCGDGVQTPDEGCDDGNTADGDGCSSTCTPELSSVCGDGDLAPNEQCDDGNEADGDGCSGECVCEPETGRVTMTPRVIEQKSTGDFIMATIVLEGPSSVKGVDSDFPFSLFVEGAGPILAVEQGRTGNRFRARFPRDAVAEVAPLGGAVEFRVRGRLLNGCFLEIIDHVRVIRGDLVEPFPDGIK
jgi:cysteine-rich repeat protein